MRIRGKKLLSWILVFALLCSVSAAHGALYAAAAKKIKLNVNKTKTMQIGQSYKLKVRNLPKKAKKIKYKWSSSKKKVASVTKKGKVNAKKIGTAKITCKVTYKIIKNGETLSEKKKLSCKIKVVKASSVTEAPVVTPAPTAKPEPAVTPAPTSKPTPTPEPTSKPTSKPTPEPTPTIAPFPPLDVEGINDGDTGKSELMTEPGEMRADMTAKDYAKEMGVGINLGNTFDGYWADENNKTSGAQTIGENKPQNYETCWGAVVTTKEAVDGMKKAGFSTVRIPVYWGNMMKDDGTFTINKEYIKRVEEVAGWCLDNGMYAVINIHHYDEFIIRHYSEEEALAITESLWKQIANYFKDYSDYLIFEGFNENVGSRRDVDIEKYPERSAEIYNYVNALNQTFVDAVRGTGGNNEKRLLIASGYWTNIDNTTDEKFIMPEDSAADRLMISVHYIDNAMYWAKNIGGQEWLDYSRQQCELLKKAFTDKNIPVFVGECTAIYGKANMAANPLYKTSSECLKRLLDMATDYGFVPVLWDTNDNAYSRTQYKMKSESDQAVITEIAEKIAGR